MANEISFSVSLGAVKGGAQVSGAVTGSADLAGTEMAAIVQTLTTTAAVLSIGGCDQRQATYIRNMDDTVAVTIGLDNASPPTQIVSTIPAGKAVLLWGGPTALYGVSASSTADIFTVVIET